MHGFIEKWLQGLPSLLVQLKDASPGMTELVLRVMKKAMVQHVLQPDDNCLAHLALFFCKCSDKPGSVDYANQLYIQLESCYDPHLC